MDAVQRAYEMGFTLASPVTPDMVASKQQLRDLCNPRDCDHYGTCWSCPPGAGAFEECVERIAAATEGLVVQTKRDGVDFNDTETLDGIRTLHNGNLDKLADELRQRHEGVLEFSTGGCNLCTPCTYPDSPCNMPKRQRLALSAHGIDVPELCDRAGMEYDFANGTIRFIGLILY